MVNTNKTNLDEISIIRPILILILVFYHAFCPYSGAWEPFEGIKPNSCYHWLADIAYSFMLPMFVFQSGYVWAYQRNRKGFENFPQLIMKKGKRLIIPSIIFSIAYLLIFGNQNNKTIIDTLTNILTGVAHMWFLPMLFGCFVSSWIINQIRSYYLKWCIIIVFYLISFVQLPFHLDRIFNYLVYFQIGYDIYKLKDKIKSNCYQLIFLWITFLIIFIGCNIIKDSIWDYIHLSNTIINKAILMEINNFLTLAYSIYGIAGMYLTALFFSRKFKIPQWLINLGNLCFGVYLFQQFILIWIYYYTELPEYLGNSLPWSAFTFTLLASISITYLIRATSIGRKLI